MLTRLFQIVYLLMEKPQMTAKELADIFEVSERTIYRDIDKLTLAGIPIYTNQGKHGGISILPDYVLDKSVLTTEEKKKILESLNALNEVSLSVDNDSVSKLRSFFGEQYQDWIEIEFSSWGNSTEDAAVFEQIKNAILEINQEMAFRAYEELNNITVTDRGKLLCKIEVTDINWFISYVLSYGSHMRVLEPLEI